MLMLVRAQRSMGLGEKIQKCRRSRGIEGSCSGRRSRGLHRVSKMTGLRKRGSSGGSMGFGVRDESYRPLRSTGCRPVWFSNEFIVVNEVSQRGGDWKSRART